MALVCFIFNNLTTSLFCQIYKYQFMKALKTLIILTIILGIFTIGNFSCIEKQKEKIALLEKNIELLKEEHIPMRFKISEKTGEQIKLITKFYNADNEEINSGEFTVPGQELSFDFSVVSIKDRYIAFPSKLFSNVTPASQGIKLFGYYNKDGFPEIYQEKNIDPELNQGLKEVFAKVKSGEMDSLESSFGNMVHDIKAFKSFMPGTVYSIVTHTKGGIEIVEE